MCDTLIPGIKAPYAGRGVVRKEYGPIAMLPMIPGSSLGTCARLVFTDGHGRPWDDAVFGVRKLEHPVLSLLHASGTPTHLAISLCVSSGRSSNILTTYYCQLHRIMTLLLTRPPS